MKYRIEFDSIGKIKVPGDKYWGASTERSNKYFNIGDFLVRPLVIHSIAIIKKAAAIVNAKNKDLDPKISKYIIKAADEVIKGKLDDTYKNRFLKYQDKFYSYDKDLLRCINDDTELILWNNME